jgi:hypothetical protein
MFPVGNGRPGTVLTPFAASPDGVVFTPPSFNQAAHRDRRQWLTTNEIALAFETEADGQWLRAGLPSVLRRLRYFSKQPTLPRNSVARFAREAPEIVARPTVVELRGTQIRSDLLRAVTADTLRRLGSDDTVPIFADVLLDAIEAMLEFDFRKSILYSAIALEAGASSAIESEYERLRRLPGQTLHRFLPARGNQDVHDPIFVRLADRANSRMRLHELPLYLFGRSLLVQNEPLFTRALRLSGTRNGLAHAGDAGQRADAYALDLTSASECLETARQVFDWFDLESDYPTVITHEDLV